MLESEVDSVCLPRGGSCAEQIALGLVTTNVEIVYQCDRAVPPLTISRLVMVDMTLYQQPPSPVEIPQDTSSAQARNLGARPDIVLVIFLDICHGKSLQL